MTDSLAPLRELPRATKGIAALLVAVLSIFSSLTVCVVYAQDLVTQAELDAAISAERKRLNEQSEERERAEKKKAEDQAARDGAMMRRLVSLEAADIEPDRRRAAAAAAHARAAFDDAIARGIPLATAAQRALDDLPPWRRK